MKNIKKFLLIPLFAIVCMFARIDSAAAVDYPFSLTTSSIAANGTFQFYLSAQGTFYVDCGTGGTLSSDNSTANGMISGGTINKTNTTNYTFKCTYSSAGTKTIRFGGTATAYDTGSNTAAIGFNTSTAKALISSISGDLSAVFPYLGSGSGQQPLFNQTFKECTKLTSLPENLFRGITGVVARMFYHTFYGCTGLTGYIPPSMFAGLVANGSPYSGSGSTGAMYQIFYNTGSLNTSCPSGTTKYTTNYESYWGKHVSCVSTSTQMAVTYSCGDGSGTPPAETTTQYNASFTPAANTCTVPSGKVFFGWTVSGTNDIKPAGTAFTWNYAEDKTLTAQYISPPFSVTTTNIAANGTFQFKLSAKGTFYVDCGDGGTLSGTGVSGETITKTNITEYTYTCTYSSAGTKTIRFGGTATQYNTSSTTAAIGFNTSTAKALISSISGDLSAVFPYISSSYSPSFYQTFSGCKNLTSIPGTLFSHYTIGKTLMFSSTFSSCTGLTSLPQNLFSNLTSAGTQMFQYTFKGCTGLTSIPENLFSSGVNNVNLSGLSSTFSSTFEGCTGLTSIPENLFSHVMGGGTSMFWSTFKGCAGLTSIPENLFSHITSSESSLFSETFSGCTGLTSIPENLFSFGGNNVSGQVSMFNQTFYNCTGLTSLPKNLFSHVTSAANKMFYQTFYNCTGLTGYIPPSTFAGLIANGSPYSGSGSTSGMMYQTFNNTGSLRTSCPTGTTQVTTGYEDYWDSHVACAAPITCSSGYYLPAGFETCAICPSGYMCSGGTFGFNATTDQGKVVSIALTWYDGNSTISGPTSCTIGGVFLPPTPPARTGYVFNGWKIKSVNP